MARDADVAVPSDTAVAAGARSLPLRRGRRFPWAPYALLLPVVLTLAAVLAYPSYKLVTLSFQKYGLFELIQRKGHWVGLDNFDSVLHDRVFWDTVVRTVIFTIANGRVVSFREFADSAGLNAMYDEKAAAAGR